MGLCYEFGPLIREGCDHAMVAGAESCHCPECGVVCKGRFDGCPAVWTGTKAQGAKSSQTQVTPPAARRKTRRSSQPEPAVRAGAAESVDETDNPNDDAGFSWDDDPSDVPAAPMQPDAGDDVDEATLIHWLEDSVTGLTDALKSLSASVRQQGQETRQLLEAQHNATRLLLEAIHGLSGRSLPAGNGVHEDVAPSAPPVEVLQPEVVSFEADIEDASVAPSTPLGGRMGDRR